MDRKILNGRRDASAVLTVGGLSVDEDLGKFLEDMEVLKELQERRDELVIDKDESDKKKGELTEFFPDEKMGWNTY